MRKIYGQRNDLPIEVIKKGVFRLNEFDGTNCYLVLGEEKAMLIDCGTGFCDMRGAVRKITDLPILLVATHGHGDHMGGRGQFEEIYIHENDCTKINMLQGSLIFRKFFTAFNAPVKANGFKMKDAKRPEFKTKVIPVSDGHEFDLGGKIIKAKLTPGHTKGSVALIDETDGIVFSGDNVCDALWMQLPGCTSIEEWIPSAEWLYEISKNYDVYWGHRVARLESDYIKTVLDWGKELVNKTKKNGILPIIKQYPDQKDGILYLANRVLKKKEK